MDLKYKDKPDQLEHIYKIAMSFTCQIREVALWADPELSSEWCFEMAESKKRELELSADGGVVKQAKLATEKKPATEAAAEGNDEKELLPQPLQFDAIVEVVGVGPILIPRVVDPDEVDPESLVSHRSFVGTISDGYLFFFGMLQPFFLGPGRFRHLLHQPEPSAFMIIISFES